MNARKAIAVTTLLMAAGLATSQVAEVAVTTDDQDTEGTRPTDANVGVNDNAALVVTNMRMTLFNKSGVEQATEQVGDSTFPVVKTDTTDGRFFDPRADYDPINDRLWYFYSEDNSTPTKIGGDIARVHIGVSIEDATLDELDDTDWHLYTGDPAPSGAAGTAFDLTDDVNLQPYRSGSPLLELGALYDLPSLAFDEEAMIMCGYSGNAGELITVFTIIPYDHSGGSILDGDRPDESDITVIWLTDPEIGGTGAEDDESRQNYAVQEPHDQAVNASFYIGVVPVTGKQTALRLRGLYYDDTNDEWVVQQQRDTATPHDLEDMGLPSTSLEFHASTSPKPETPEDDWGTSGTEVGPSSRVGFFSSAVLVKTGNNVWRIFATHAVRPDESGSAGDQWVVQWYVIDPKLGDLESTTVGGWQPVIDEAGRIDGGQAGGDRYHPTIGVTEQGVAYLEYTFSDDETWPEVRRVELNSTYDAILPNSEMTVQTGPDTAYSGDFWADYADMQADPDGDCAFWSTHTLVHDQDGTDPQSIDKRDVWIFEKLFNCNNSNLNGDSGTDLYDMALFNSYYATGARRVDMNTDGTTDSADAAIYADEYDKATGP